MKKIKIIAGGLNGSYKQISATSIGANGRIRSLKRDGTFIEGRYPMPEEEPELWHYDLTTKERIDKNDTRLVSTLYVPEEGVDHIDNSNKHKIALYDHIINHQDGCYLKDVIEGGIFKRMQVNPNYRRNHLLSFMIEDESAVEQKRFNDARIETKYRAIIDTLYDKSNDKGAGEFMEMCYGTGIMKPERNTKLQNYNLLVNKLQINPSNFALYYEDKDRKMVNVIQKGMKIGETEQKPHITQEGAGPYYFNSTAIGKNMDEMKLHFKQHQKEYEWLEKVTQPKEDVVIEAPKVLTEVTKVEIQVTPEPQSMELKNSYDGMDANTRKKFANLNREIGRTIGLLHKGKTKNEQGRINGALKAIDKLKSENPGELGYINTELSKKALEKGITIS